MTDSWVAIGMDRLPWLPDEPPARQTKLKAGRSGNNIVAWAFAALLIVAGVSFWLGTRTTDQSPLAAPPSATVTLPAQVSSQPLNAGADQVQPVTPPALQPVQEPEIHRVTERPAAASRPTWRPLPREVPQDVADRVQRTMATDEADRVAGIQTGTPPKAAPAVPVVPNTQSVRLWSARESGGAFGRVVQIGAFGSRQQAKLGWRYMSRAYPGVKRLPAVVVEAHNSHGRPFYRFQIGTTSQAHSEILCQRMGQIRLSCAVVGLPGEKRTVER
jgi:hypothetical protein